MDTRQDTNPPHSGWKDKSKDAHPPSPNSDKKNSEDVPQAIRKALLVCNTGCMSSLLDDITQNLMAIEDEDTIIMGDIIMSDRSNKEDGNAGSED